MRDFDDNEFPLAYLITFRCYGTWLHGDQRRSMNRKQNVYGTPRIAHKPGLERTERGQLQHEPVTLNAKQRAVVEKAVREVCLHRKYRLRAINVRTNHVHVVVSIGVVKPSRALNALKANATRQLREDRNWNNARSPWADKGSERIPME